MSGIKILVKRLGLALLTSNVFSVDLYLLLPDRIFSVILKVLQPVISHLCLPGNRNLNQIIISENEMHHREKTAKCYTKFRMLKEHSGINSLWFPLNEIILCTYGPQSSKVKDLPYLLLDSHALSRLPRGWRLFFFCLTFGLLLIRLIKDPQSSPKSHFSRYFLMTLFPPSYGDFSVYIKENIK